MLVTRPEPDASETAARLNALGIEGVPCPLLEFQPLEGSLPGAEGFAAMALTSAQALRALEAKGQLERYLGLKVYAVGARTAAAARAAGFADVTSADGGFAELASLLRQVPLAGPVFYPAARDLAGDLARALAPAGRMVITAQVYRMVPATALPAAVEAELGDKTLAAALFYSRRTAEVFVRLVSGMERPARRALGVLCLSEAVAAPLVDAHFVRIGLAEHPSEDAMMGLALSFLRDHSAR